MAGKRRCMGGSLRCASLYSNGAGAEGKSHRFAGGCGAVLTAVTSQDGRGPVKAACVKDAEGDSHRDIVEMKCIGAELSRLLAVEYADTALASICGQQYVSFRSPR